MSKVILYGPQGSGKTLLAEKLMKRHPDHTLIEEWNGSDEIPPNSIMVTNLMPPFEVPLDCLVVGVGVTQCPTCGD